MDGKSWQSTSRGGTAVAAMDAPRLAAMAVPARGPIGLYRNPRRRDQHHARCERGRQAVPTGGPIERVSLRARASCRVVANAPEAKRMNATSEADGRRAQAPAFAEQALELSGTGRGDAASCEPPVGTPEARADRDAGLALADMTQISDARWVHRRSRDAEIAAKRSTNGWVRLAAEPRQGADEHLSPSARDRVQS